MIKSQDFDPRIAQLQRHGRRASPNAHEPFKFRAGASLTFDLTAVESEHKESNEAVDVLCGQAKLGQPLNRRIRDGFHQVLKGALTRRSIAVAAR